MRFRGSAATIATAGSKQRRGRRFRDHPELEHHPEHARRALLLEGTIGPSDFGFDCDAMGLAGTRVVSN